MSIINLHDKNLFYIGGVVRDELLNQKSFDIDITYVGNAIEYAQTIENAEIIQTNEPFGTVKIKLDGKEIDIASTRNEIYPKKGHLPKVCEIGCSLKEDVLRRDFTINALAKSTLTGEIIDYTGGFEDIKNKTLKVLHKNSFIDDPTRIVRGLKFAVRFEFKLDKETQRLQNEYLNNVNYDMSYKRLKKELVETFNLNSQIAFERFIEQKIYRLLTVKDYTVPEINLEKLIKKYSPECVWIIYAGLFDGIEKLPLTKKEMKIVQNYKELKDFFSNDDLEIYKTFENVELETLIMLFCFIPNIVERYLDKLRYIKVQIKGSDLKKLGITPGENYQKCFEYIMAEKFKNPSLSQVEELQLVKDFFNLK